MRGVRPRAPLARDRDGTRRPLHVRVGHRREEGSFARLFSDLLDAQPWLRRGAYALAGATAVYAGSLGVVSLPASWDRATCSSPRSGAPSPCRCSSSRAKASRASPLLGASVALVLAYDVPDIAEVERSWAFGIVAAGRVRRCGRPGSFARASSSSCPPWSLRRERAARRRRRCWSCYNGKREGAALLALASATRRSASRSCAAGATSHPCSACSRSGWPFPASIELLERHAGSCSRGPQPPRCLPCSPATRSGSSGRRLSYLRPRARPYAGHGGAAERPLRRPAPPRLRRRRPCCSSSLPASHSPCAARGCARLALAVRRARASTQRRSRSCERDRALRQRQRRDRVPARPHRRQLRCGASSGSDC